ncbi:hypothetical protein UlMin_020787 [Ulmus minor]
MLFYKGKLVLPTFSVWITRFLHEFHDPLVGGHSGFFQTFKRISENLFWHGMKKDIRDYLAGCKVCQKSKSDTLSPAGLLQPLPIPTLIWEDISMDFVGGLPQSKGIDTILVVVDRLSKYTHFCPLIHPFTTKQVAELFAIEIVRLHGIPRSIVSDRDPIFMSGFWKELFCLQGSKLHHSSAYHPQSDGQTEVVNHYLESYLRCFACDKPRTWSGCIFRTYNMNVSRELKKPSKYRHVISQYVQFTGIRNDYHTINSTTTMSLHFTHKTSLKNFVKNIKIHIHSKPDCNYVNRTKTEGPKTESPVSQADSNTKHFRSLTIFVYVHLNYIICFVPEFDGDGKMLFYYTMLSGLLVVVLKSIYDPLFCLLVTCWKTQ